jgi:2-polyprenyl-6-hydroxyphenyl methylase/3-demethylubiquinone-9 3-methyltransferase
MLGVQSLAGKNFLDIGSGSGIFSLAACRMGARVHSFDFDPDSVDCTRILKSRYFPADPHWTIAEGSVLDDNFMHSLGQFDVVYSWGVLHHTGQMWRAVGNAVEATAPGGLLFIALYNDEGPKSRIWWWIKRTFNFLPLPLRIPYGVVISGLWELRAFLVECAKLQPWKYFQNWFKYQKVSLRGMSRWHDIIDWIGGFPFEVAKPEEVLDAGRARGLTLIRLVTTRGLGCNQYVFLRPA